MNMYRIFHDLIEYIDREGSAVATNKVFPIVSTSIGSDYALYFMRNLGWLFTLC